MIVAVIPAYNEQSRMSSTVQSVKKYVDQVLVVDDGSSDATGDIAKQHGAMVVRHMSNCGAGAATMTGIEAARLLGAKIVITIDADEQHSPEDIPALLYPIEHDKVDVVFANRFGAKNTMRECHKDYGRFKGQAKRLKEYLINNEKNKYEEMCNSISPMNKETKDWLNSMDEVIVL